MWLEFSVSIVMLLLLGLAMFKFKFIPFGMTALTEDADVPKREGALFVFPVATAKKIYAGAFIVLNSSGYAEPGTAATGKIAVGRAASQVDNTNGSDGDLTVDVERGIFRYKNSTSTDLIARTEIGEACYIVDDQTVAKTSASGTRSIGGKVVDVDSDGVWVEVGSTLSLDGDLVAANNLSDVADVGTARANIGANKVVLLIPVATLVGTGVYRVVSPVAGTITKIWSVTDGALTVGDATLTGKIGATAITAGAITIAQAGSAAGDVDSATPSALNVVAAGNVVSVTVGGTNETASGAMVSILIET